MDLLQISVIFAFYFYSIYYYIMGIKLQLKWQNKYQYPFQVPKDCWCSIKIGHFQLFLFSHITPNLPIGLHLNSVKSIIIHIRKI